MGIDFAIDRTGGVDPKHAAAYKQFGDWIRSCYGTPVAHGSMPKGQTSFELSFASASIDRVLMEEDQTRGQLIIDYIVEANVGGTWVQFSAGTTVGAKRIDLGGKSLTATGVRFSVTSGFGKPTGLKLSVFDPRPCAFEHFESILI